MSDGEYIPITEAASVMGVSRTVVVKLIRQQRIRTQRTTDLRGMPWRMYSVSRSDAENYVRRRPGRPKKSEYAQYPCVSDPKNNKNISS